MTNVDLIVQEIYLNVETSCRHIVNIRLDLTESSTERLREEDLLSSDML